MTFSLSFLRAHSISLSLSWWACDWDFHRIFLTTRHLIKTAVPRPAFCAESHILLVVGCCWCRCRRFRWLCCCFCHRILFHFLAATIGYCCCWCSRHYRYSRCSISFPFCVFCVADECWLIAIRHWRLMQTFISYNFVRWFIAFWLSRRADCAELWIATQSVHIFVGNKQTSLLSFTNSLKFNSLSHTICRSFIFIDSYQYISSIWLRSSLT